MHGVVDVVGVSERRMSESTQPPLEKLSRSDLTIADRMGDVRGRQVVTVDDERIGIVSDLLVNPNDQKIRFLEVNIERITGPTFRGGLLPIQVVTQVDEL